MNYLDFYMQFAVLQSERWGRAVSVKDLKDSTGYSRSQVYRYINALIASNYVFKAGRGKYYLNACKGSQAIGFVAVTAMEMFEYDTLRGEAMANEQ